MTALNFPTKAFVTGANGAIGSALTKRLSHLGWEVAALVRPGSEATHLTHLAGVEIVRGELGDAAALATGCCDRDAVFHLAALVHADPGTSEAQFQRVNAEGTRLLAEAAVKARVARFVYFSTVAVYPASGMVMDENSVVAPESPYGRSKLDGERVVMSTTPRMGVTILRLPVVYGPHDRGNVARLIQAIREGKFALAGDGRNVKSMLALDNAIDAAVLVATDARAVGATYVVTDARDYTQVEIAETIAEILGKSRRFLKLPLRPMIVLARLADAFSSISGMRLPLTVDRVTKLATSARYSGARLRTELGFIPRQELREGLIQQIEAMPPRNRAGPG